MNATEESIRNYHRTYYTMWKAEYDEYVMAAARMTTSAEYPRMALSSALTYQMIYERPGLSRVCRYKSQRPSW